MQIMSIFHLMLGVSEMGETRIKQLALFLCISDLGPIFPKQMRLAKKAAHPNQSST